MTTNYKLLGQTAPTAQAVVTHYQVPASTSTLIRSINVTNTSSTPDTFTIQVGGIIGSFNVDDCIAVNTPIEGNSTMTIKAGYTLAAADGIRVRSSNGTTTFSTFGAEIS